MAERELAIIIRAKDLASKSIKGIKGEIGSLGKAGSRAMDGLSTAIRRVGTASAVGLVGAIGLGARSLGHLERVANQTNAVLESTGNVSGQTAESIRTHAEALEELTTADDKAIQEAQNLLLTFTKIGGETFPEATEAAINMAIAMAKGDVANADFKGSALQVGKALNDPIKGMAALSRAGVSFTKEQKELVKQLVETGRVEEAQAVILKELTTEFGNAGKAAGTGFEADMRRLEDAGEDATAALAKGVMPALTRVAKWLTTKLADPAVIKAIEELGQGLGDAAQSALDFIETVDFKAIGDGLSIAADAAGGIVGAFMGMPDWVKTAVITGWGLNKLTGGAVTGIIGELGKGLVKGVLGMNAGVVNINAGRVMGGGVPAGGAAGAAGGGRLGGLVSGALKIAGVVGLTAVAIEALGVRLEQAQANQAQGAATVEGAKEFAQTATEKEMLASLDGIEKYTTDLAGSLTPEAIAYQLNIDGVRTRLDETKVALRHGLAEAALKTQRAGERVAGQVSQAAATAARYASGQAAAAAGIKAQVRASGQQQAAAIRDKDLSVSVKVNSVANISLHDFGKKATAVAKIGLVAS